MQSEKQWYVFYTKSRHEKKVQDLLEKRGTEVFLPTHKVMRQWSDRKKKVDVPLFNSYIFVKVFEHEIPSVLQTPGVSWTIRYNGQPAVLREAEVDTIKRFIATGFFMESGAYNAPEFQRGDKAVVVDGPLKGISGVVTGLGDDKVLEVLIDGIQQVIRVHLPAQILKKTN